MPLTDAEQPPSAEARLMSAGVRRLTPETTTVFEGAYALLHCAVKGETPYRGVFAVRMFPVRDPARFISLRWTDLEDEEQEIGVIEDLGGFPAEQQALIDQSLAHHYNEQRILRVLAVRSEYGLLFFDIETQRGREQLIMPWRGDRAEDYGDKGKVLLDAYDNRYILADVNALPAPDRRKFSSFIYW